MDSGLYTKEYFIGNTISNYSDYSKVDYILYKYAEMLNEYFSPSSVFDAGCAVGFVPDWFVEKGIHASGCDISEWASSHSRNIYQADMRNIPEKDNSFELVTSTAVIEHIPPEDIEQTLKELYRISSKYVVMFIDMYETPPENNIDPGDITHLTFYSKKKWEDIIDELGFKRDLDKEKILNEHPFSIQMTWAGKFIIVQK